MPRRGAQSAGSAEDQPLKERPEGWGGELPEDPIEASQASSQSTSFWNVPKGFGCELSEHDSSCPEDMHAQSTGVACDQRYLQFAIARGLMFEASAQNSSGSDMWKLQGGCEDSACRGRGTGVDPSPEDVQTQLDEVQTQNVADGNDDGDLRSCSKRSSARRRTSCHRKAREPRVQQACQAKRANPTGTGVEEPAKQKRARHSLPAKPPAEVGSRDEEEVHKARASVLQMLLRQGAGRRHSTPVRAADSPAKSSVASPKQVSSPHRVVPLKDLADVAIGARVDVKATVHVVGELEQQELLLQPGESVARRTLVLLEQQDSSVCDWLLWAGDAERYGPAYLGNQVLVRGAKAQEFKGKRRLTGCTSVDICD